jgi:hypothetical protein
VGDLQLKDMKGIQETNAFNRTYFGLTAIPNELEHNIHSNGNMIT